MSIDNSKLDRETLKNRLKYQGKQYDAGCYSMGGTSKAPHMLTQAAEAIDELEAALESIEITAQAGLCYFTLGSARECLKDVRDKVADALNKERAERDS